MVNSELKVGDILFQLYRDEVTLVKISKISIKDNCVSVKVLRNKTYSEDKEYHINSSDSPFLYGHKNGYYLTNDNSLFYLKKINADNKAIEVHQARKWDNLIYTRKKMANINKEIDELVSNSRC